MTSSFHPDQNGGPAFARPAIPDSHDRPWDAGAEGMTLRDYIATHAMAALIVADKVPEPSESMAQFAYEIADTMLQVRVTP